MKSLAAFGLLLLSCVYASTSPASILCPLFSATPAITDYSVANTSGGHVLYLFGSSLTSGIQQFVWTSDGGFLSVNSSSAVLTGSLIGLGGGSAQNGFNLTLLLSAAPAAAGVIEVSPESLVDPSTWSFFTVDSGSSLVGFGSFSGITLAITQQTPLMPFQIGFGGSGKNLLYGGGAWLNIQSANTLVAGDININLNCTQTPICPSGNSMSASAALDDSFSSDGSGGAFTFFEPPAGIDVGWIFAEDSGILTFAGDSLHLTGQIIPLSGNHTPLSVDISLVATTTPAAPHIELLPSAYVQNGGPINPSLWTFYNFASSGNTISGSGLTLAITQQMDTMPFQLGWGASGKNIRFGASAWFTWSLDGKSYSGDINIDLNCPNSTVPPPPPPPPPSGCSLSLSPVLRTSWTSDGQDFFIYDVTMTNNGSQALRNVQIQFDFPASLNCTALPGATCTNEVWNLGTASTPGRYSLPDFLAQFGGLAAGSSFIFGAIVLSNGVQFTAQPTC